MQEPLNIPVKQDGDFFEAPELNTIVAAINTNIQDIEDISNSVNVGLDYIIPDGGGNLDV
ncbi:hypothetical protein [Pedobacter steynii]